MSVIEAPRLDSDPASSISMAFRDARSGGGEVSEFEDSDEDQSWHSVFGSYGEDRISGEIKDFAGSESSSEVDLESGDLEVKVHLGKIERDCRICHLEIGRDCEAQIELGCRCRGDLGTAHRQCAETWFKIKGNTICEICGANAQNVTNPQTNESSNSTAGTSSASTTAALAETRTIFHGRRIMNFLLACMLLAFAMSWIFHFKLMS